MRNTSFAFSINSARIASRFGANVGSYHVFISMMPQSSIKPLESVAGASLRSPRLVSLDAFRGITMALMVIVNNPGSGGDSYAPLNHAEWNGWTITDTVFPSFLWIVGVAITLSLGRQAAGSKSRAQLLAQIFRRSAILFGLGLSVYAFPHFDLSTQRIMGVLQRIAICYLAAATIYLFAGLRGQILWIIGLLTAYWMLMTLIPVPGYGQGRLDVEGNFAHYVDAIVLGRHNYAQTRTWDPEGIVSTLPAIATALLGMLAGRILRLQESLAERTTRLFLIGNLLMAAGVICEVWLPINKKLWTDSFTLFMAGLDFVVLAIFIYAIDFRGWKTVARPFSILGMNAIAIYLASEFLDEFLHAVRWNSGAGVISLQEAIYRTVFAPLASPANASLLYSISFALCMYGIAYLMYRRGWFLRF
jgi:predicted acyltransferase